MVDEFECYTRAEVLVLMKDRRAEIQELEILLLSSDEEASAGENEKRAHTRALNKILLLKGEMDRMKQHLKSLLTKVEPTSSPQTLVSSSSPSSAIISGMRNYVESNVMKFDPNKHAVSEFLAQLDVAYSLYVTEDLEYGNKLIPSFIQAAKSRITHLALQQIQIDGKSSFSTFDEFKKELTSRYSRLRTGFQLLEEVWLITPNENESMSDVATRLEREMAAAAGVIKSSFKEEHKKDMTVDQAFQMISAKRLLEFVKDRNQLVYQNLVARTTPMFNCSSIAADADQLETRFGNTDESSGSYYAKPGGNQQMRKDFVRKDSSRNDKAPTTRNNDDKASSKKTPVCWNWRDKGYCNKHSDGTCKYDHPEDKKGIRQKPKSMVMPKALYNQMTDEQIEHFRIKPAEN